MRSMRVVGLLAAFLVIVALFAVEASALANVRVTNCGFHEANGPYVCGHVATYSCDIATTYPHEVRSVAFIIYGRGLQPGEALPSRQARLTSGTRSSGTWSWSWTQSASDGAGLVVDAVIVADTDDPTICMNYVPDKKDGSDPNNPCSMSWSEVKPYTGDLPKWMIDNYQRIEGCRDDVDIVQCQWTKKETCSGDLLTTTWTPNSVAACGKGAYTDPPVYKDCCTPSWQPSGITGCIVPTNQQTLSGNVLRTYIDKNGCYAKTGLSSDNNPPVGSGYTQSCMLDGWLNQGRDTGGSGESDRGMMGSRILETPYQLTGMNNYIGSYAEPLVFDVDQDGKTEIISSRGVIDTVSGNIAKFSDASGGGGGPGQPSPGPMINTAAIAGISLLGPSYGQTVPRGIMKSTSGQPLITGFVDYYNFVWYNYSRTTKTLKLMPYYKTVTSPVYSGPSCVSDLCYYIDSSNVLYETPVRTVGAPVTQSIDLSSGVTGDTGLRNQIPIFVDGENNGASASPTRVIVLGTSSAGVPTLFNCPQGLVGKTIADCSSYSFVDTSITTFSKPVYLGQVKDWTGNAFSSFAGVAIAYRKNVGGSLVDMVTVLKVLGNSIYPVTTMNIATPSGSISGVTSNPVAAACQKSNTGTRNRGVGIAKSFKLSGDSNTYVYYNCYSWAVNPSGVYLTLVGQHKDVLASDGKFDTSGPYTLAAGRVNNDPQDMLISAYGVFDTVNGRKLLSLSGRTAGESVAVVDVNSDGRVDTVISQNAYTRLELSDANSDPPVAGGTDVDPAPDPVDCKERPTDPACQKGPCDPAVDPTCKPDPCPGCQPCPDCIPLPAMKPTFKGLDCYYNKDLKRVEAYVISPVAPHPDAIVYNGKLKSPGSGYSTKEFTSNPLLFPATLPGTYSVSVTMKDPLYDNTYVTGEKTCYVEVSNSQVLHDAKLGCDISPDGEFNYYKPTSQFNWVLGDGMWLIRSDTSKTLAASEPDTSSGSYAKFFPAGSSRLMSILHKLDCSRSQVTFDTYMQVAPMTEAPYWFEFEVYGVNQFDETLPVADFRVRSAEAGEPTDFNVYVYDVDKRIEVPVGKINTGEFHKVSVTMNLATAGKTTETFTVSVDGTPFPQVFGARNAGIKKLSVVGLASTNGFFYVDYVRMSSSDAFTSMEDVTKIAERYSKAALSGCYERGEVRAPQITVGIGTDVNNPSVRTFAPGDTSIYPHITDFCNRLYNTGIGESSWCDMEWLQESVQYNPKCYWEAMNYCTEVTYPKSNGFEDSDVALKTNGVADRSAGMTACSTVLMGRVASSKIIGAVINGSIAGFTDDDGKMAMIGIVTLAVIVVGVMAYNKSRGR